MIGVIRFLIIGTLVVLFFGSAGCAKKQFLDWEVRASTAEEFNSFRTGLGAACTREQLQLFDTAIQELKLDAMNRGVAGVNLREDQMRAAANRKTVKDVLILGWQARRSRVMAELTDMTERLAHDSKLLDRPATADSAKFLSNLIQNEKDIVAQLQRQLADADEKLAEWGTRLGEPPASNE